MIDLCLRQRWTSTLLVCLFASPTFAWHLEALLEELKANNPACLLALEQIKASQSQAVLAGTLEDPSIQVGVFAQEVETRVGAQQMSLRVAQKLPWPGKRALKVRIVEKQTDALIQAYERVFLEKASDFQRLYADLYYVGQTYAIHTQHASLLENLEGVVTQNYENNAASYGELIQIQIEIDQTQQKIATQERASQPLIAALNALLGRAIGDAMPLPPNLPEYVLREALLQPALDDSKTRNHPQLKGLNHRIAQAQLDLELAQLAKKPNFEAGLTWIQTKSTGNVNVRNDGKDPLLLTFGVQVPIWKKKNRARVLQAKSLISAAEHALDDQQAALNVALETHRFQFQDAQQQKILYAENIIPKAEESLRVLLESFETGTTTYQELIEAERRLLAFRLSLIKADVDRFKAIVSMQQAMGVNPLKKGETHVSEP